MNSQEVMMHGGTLWSAILFIGFIVAGMVIFVLWLWSLIHCAKNRQLNDTNRIIGIVLIVFLGPLGSLVYLFLPRETSGPIQTE